MRRNDVNGNSQEHAFDKNTFTFQGDRFGGALDAAANQFSNAVDSGMIPMEFVNTMRKKGKLIMGIGHRVKSVSHFGMQQFCPTY